MSFTFTKYTKEEIEELKNAVNIAKQKQIKSTQKPEAQKKILEVSKYIYLFEGFKSDEISEIVSNLKLLTTKKNEIIYPKNAHEGHMFILINGKAEIKMVEKNISIKPLELFGEFLFLTKEENIFDIVTTSEKATFLRFNINEDANCCLLNMIYANIAYKIANKYKKKVSQIIKL